jgi:predicted DNA-binding transcriptional regulator AlpA
MHIVDPLLSAREAAEFLQISNATFWRRVADGTVPPPIKLGSLSRWPQSEIADVIEQAKARRDQVHGTTSKLEASSAHLDGRTS